MAFQLLNKKIFEFFLSVKRFHKSKTLAMQILWLPNPVRDEMWVEINKKSSLSAVGTGYEKATLRTYGAYKNGG